MTEHMPHIIDRGSAYDHALAIQAATRSTCMAWLVIRPARMAAQTSTREPFRDLLIEASRRVGAAPR